MRIFKILLRVDDPNELGQDEVENAVEETLQYLGYDLIGSVVEIEETDEEY